MENLHCFLQHREGHGKVYTFLQQSLDNVHQNIFFYPLHLHKFFHQHKDKHRELRAYLYLDKTPRG